MNEDKLKKLDKLNKRALVRSINEIEEKLETRRQALEKTQNTTALIIDEIEALQNKRDKYAEQLRKDREIMDFEAPNCGAVWLTAHKEQLEDALQDFLYKYAKKYGRSTLAIRFKVGEAIVPFIPRYSWERMKEESDARG